MSARQHVWHRIDSFIRQVEKENKAKCPRAYDPGAVWDWADALLRGERFWAAAQELGHRPRGVDTTDIEFLLDRLRRALHALDRGLLAADELDLQNMAVALLLDPQIGTNASAIADKLGVPRTTLLGWSEFRKRYDQLREQGVAAKRRRRRGRRAGANDFTDETDNN
jgi:hypothetical protein